MESEVSSVEYSSAGCGFKEVHACSRTVIGRKRSDGERTCVVIIQENYFSFANLERVNQRGVDEKQPPIADGDADVRDVLALMRPF